MTCMIAMLFQRKINVSFTVTKFTRPDTRRISTAPPPTVTNLSITTDTCPLIPPSLQDLPRDIPTDKQFIPQEGVNTKTPMLSLLRGFPPLGCHQIDPCMPRGQMGTLQGLLLLTLSIILDMCKIQAWDIAALPFTPLLTLLSIRQRCLCLTMLRPCSGAAEMQWIPIA